MTRHDNYTFSVRRRLKDGWTPEIDNELFNFFNERCVICGVRRSEDNEITRDHVIPKADGGKLVPGNVVLLCLKCNNAKASLRLKDLSGIDHFNIEEAALAFQEHWDYKVWERRRQRSRKRKNKT